MRNIVRYSVLRFMPFAVTREFANVGILVHEPATGFVGYKLAEKNFKRVAQFFEEFDHQLYNASLDSFNQELERVQAFTKGFRGRELALFMDEVTRQREGIMTFGETKTIYSEQSPSTLVDELFEKFIGRSFKNTREYREAQMARTLKVDLLHNVKVQYKEQQLSVGYGGFRLPLVGDHHGTVKAIKPLSFNQKTPIEMVEHGDKWISRVRHLLNANTLTEDNFLFTLEQPKKAERDYQAAYNTIIEGMKELQVQVFKFEDKASIYGFADFSNALSVDNFQLN